MLLKKKYPSAKCELNHGSPFQLLVATILSAQCTDARVNLITKGLFQKFPDSLSMEKLSLKALERFVRSSGFYKNKAKNILASVKIINEKFKGQIPSSLEELMTLPGVGRKTANVVMGNAFNKAAGVVVDTHVGRLAFRMGLTKSKEPDKIEEDLKKILPQKEWILFSHLMIFHGRQVCKARKPHCKECFLVELCPQKGVTS